jgi:hypothetical protein
MIIHGKNWKEIVVSINHDGLMTHLGVIWNMRINKDKQLESLKEKLEVIGSRILRHSGRVGDKLLALEYCLRSDIVYRMQFCVWGYDDYLKPDSIYTRLVKKICRNMQSYPSKPLWMLTSDGGLGLQSLLDFANKSKLRILHHGLAFRA